MIGEILREPAGVVVWIAWLGVVNALALAFLSEVEARWTLAAFVGSFLFMSILYGTNGYNRLLGLAHVVFWTPLVIYLYRRLTHLVGPRLFEGWIRLLLATIGLALVIDYVDVLRYLLGDHG